MGDVHESVTVGRPRRNPHKPSWLTTDMIVAYALSVVEEAKHIEQLNQFRD